MLRLGGLEVPLVGLVVPLVGLVVPLVGLVMPLGGLLVPPGGPISFFGRPNLYHDDQICQVLTTLYESSPHPKRLH